MKENQVRALGKCTQNTREPVTMEWHDMGILVSFLPTRTSRVACPVNIRIK